MKVKFIHLTDVNIFQAQPAISTYWWHKRRSQRIAKVTGIHIMWGSWLFVAEFVPVHLEDVKIFHSWTKWLTNCWRTLQTLQTNMGLLWKMRKSLQHFEYFPFTYQNNQHFLQGFLGCVYITDRCSLWWLHKRLHYCLEGTTIKTQRPK